MTDWEFRLDCSDERLWRGSTPVHISQKAFKILRLFVANPNRLLTKDLILEAVWGDVLVSEGLIKEYVHDLRRVLGDDARHPRFIETVHGRGYRFLGGIASDTGNQMSEQAVGSAAHPLSLAVMPFANLSADRRQEYFADGISEDIIVGLSKSPHLSVISRNSTFAFKRKSLTAPEIGEALGARYMLEGSVRRDRRSIRITATLIDPASDRHLWAETYDRKLGDVFAIQDEIVSSIVRALGATDGAIERLARGQLARASETTLGAYDCYLKGQWHFYRRHGAGLDAAETLYRKAIELDPGFARAYSALAFLKFQRFKVYLAVPFESMSGEAHDLAQHALRLDPNDYLAHWTLGRLYSYLGRNPQGIAEFERALMINQNDAYVLADLADYLIYVGRTEEALAKCRRAIRLNPNCPDWFWWHLGFAHYHLGDYEKALEALERMASPGQARRLLAAVYAQLGRVAEARREAAEFLAHNPGFSIQKWSQREPYADPKELGRYVDGLRKAGFPE